LPPSSSPKEIASGKKRIERVTGSVAIASRIPHREKERKREREKEKD